VTAWIFQGNPDRFDLDGYLAAHSEISWLTPQHRDSMNLGDTVYIWRNAGRAKAIAGIVAVSVITGLPTVEPDNPNAKAYWIDSAESDQALHRVKLRVLDRAKAKGVIKTDWLAEDPICNDLPNLRMRQQTNYPLNDEHAERIARLWSKTGRDFDRLDLLISLRAYDQTFGSPVSKKPGEPVSLAAILTGRAVSSIYAKVMNFRSLDSREPGAGQENGGEPTSRIWNEFWTGTDLDRYRLDAALSELLSPGSEPVSLKQLEAEADEATDCNTEGRRRLVTHYRIERDRRVVDRAKAAWIVADPLLRCSTCRMSFLETYGDLGTGYIEAHHKTPLSDLASGDEIETRIEDLAPVCSNCHRMLHRKGGCSVDELRTRLSSRLNT